MIKQIFDEKQEGTMMSSTGRVLILWNETEISVEEPVLDDNGEPTGETTTVTKWQYDTEWVTPLKQSNEAILTAIKDLKIKEIDEYDVSDNVNSFSLNGNAVWLDRNTRVSLMNSLGIEKEAGKTTSTLWFGSINLNIDIELAIQLLSALELYALQCYNKTAEHKEAVRALTSIADVAGYDYTAGYPDKLTFTV